MRFICWICLGASVAAHAVFLMHVGDLLKIPRAPAPLRRTTISFLPLPEPVEAPAQPSPSPKTPEEKTHDGLAGWRKAGSPGKPRSDGEPSAAEAPEKASSEKEAAAAPEKKANRPPSAAKKNEKKKPEQKAKLEPAKRVRPKRRVRSGPRGLRLPASVARGKPSADLVIDPRPASFLRRARALGFRFILFPTKDRKPAWFFELVGPRLYRGIRRTRLDFDMYSRRARDLDGDPFFDRVRNTVAGRYGLQSEDCRVVAVVSSEVDAKFRIEERRALEVLRKSSREVRALFGELTDSKSTPMNVTWALLEEGDLVQVPRRRSTDE